MDDEERVALLKNVADRKRFYEGQYEKDSEVDLMFRLADELLESRITVALESVVKAWDKSWHEYYLEDAEERRTELHPITKTNPYRNKEN